jgi:hypothetical protein
VNSGKKIKPENPDKNSPSRRTFRNLAVVFITLSVVVGLIWGLARLGDETRRGIGPRERYSVRFADIQCDPPRGIDRSTFLSEVRYCSNFPELFQSLDPDLTRKLTSSFTTHPWVANVESVAVESDGTVKVSLKYRRPALAVRTDSGVRVVDSGGILLPVAASSTGLPEMVSPLPSPTVSSGQVWPDNSVKRAVEIVETHHPTKLEKTASGWRLTMSDGKMLVLER